LTLVRVAVTENARIGSINSTCRRSVAGRGGIMTALGVNLGSGNGPRPSWIPGHARRHQRTGELDTRWMPACQCGWAFYSSVRSLRIADRTHGYHLDRVHFSRGLPPA
jgi:hypothetical protein